MAVRQNVRGAGRKNTFTPDQVEEIKKRHENGESIAGLSQEYKVSRQTISRYINNSAERQWERLNAYFRRLDPREATLRMEYMWRDQLCSAILVDFKNREIDVLNYTDCMLHRAFGVKYSPDWNDFEEFLESRCFPRTRDNLLLILEDLELTDYDPLQIIEKTGGHMAGDDQWIRIIYREAS